MEPILVACSTAEDYEKCLFYLQKVLVTHDPHTPSLLCGWCGCCFSNLGLSQPYAQLLICLLLLLLSPPPIRVLHDSKPVSTQSDHSVPLELILPPKGFIMGDLNTFS